MPESPCCASLPITGVSVSAWYCHHHQAWHAMSSRYLQHDDDRIESTGGDTIAFGPFDGTLDVLTWCDEQLTELLVLGFSGDRLTSRQRTVARASAVGTAHEVSIEHDDAPRFPLPFDET